MPHVEMTYSANLETLVDMGALCNTIRLACIDAEVAPMAGIRVRAIKCEHVSIADGNEQHGYIDISVRLREGRSDAVKQSLTERLFNAANLFLEQDFKNHSIALSLETRDINASLSPKTGSIRNFL